MTQEMPLFQERKKRLITRSAWMIMLIFIVNYMAMMFFWYSTIWWFDIPMHFFGGFWLGITGIWAYFFNRKQPYEHMSARRIIAVAACVVLVVGIGWEVFEIAKDRLITGMPFYWLDTLSDICFDAAGALTAALSLVRRGYAEGNYS